MKSKFKSKDICVITPTKDRPHKIENLLKSLAEQSCEVGRIIIVGSGTNIESVVMKYSDRLPVEYYHSEIAGQVRQRKLAVSKLNKRTKLVATLDDDIILSNDALAVLIDFFNSHGSKTGGVGFNITNMTEHQYSRIKGLFFLSGKEPGVVLTSGYPTSITNVKENVRTMWLNGGATVWLQEIIVKEIHKKTIDSIWSPCEDLIFSYPIGKKLELWICCNAKVLHDDITIAKTAYDNFVRGRLLSHWVWEFVKQNPELIRFHFAIATLFGSILSLLKKFYKREAFFELGRLSFLIYRNKNF